MTISIIIPVYNSEKYIRECLDSILEQDYEDYEMILIDDGSSDGSVTICEEYAAEHDNISLYRQDHAGASAARNLGISRSKGSRLMFVDSDDFILPGMLKDMDAKKSDIVICGYETVRNGRAESVNCPSEMYSGPLKEFTSKYLREYMDKSIVYTQCAKLIDRQIVTENGIRFKDEYSICEDALFFLSCLAASKSVSAIRGCYYAYRQYDNESLSKRYTRNGMMANEALYHVTADNFAIDMTWLDAHFCLRFIGMLLRIYSMSDITDPKEQYKALCDGCENKAFVKVLRSTRPSDVEGGKSFQTGAWLLQHGWLKAFHIICRIRYGRKQ